MKISFLLFAGLMASQVYAQDLSMLDELGPDSSQIEYVSASYKSTRIINSASLENTAPGVLDLRISHRFGPMSDGIEEFFGLDNAVTRIGFDYGINDWLMVGIGRSTYEKAYDGFFKVKVLRQSSGARNMPVSVQFLASTTINGQSNYSDVTDDFVHRVSYCFQPIIGRKFSKNFTLQIMPSIVHHNLVQTASEENTLFSLGIGGRQKFSKRAALTFEGYVVSADAIHPDMVNYSLSIGVDIETGGHVFQLFLTNSIGMNETQFITQNYNDWGKVEIRIGFNISRVFTLVKNE